MNVERLKTTLNQIQILFHHLNSYQHPLHPFLNNNLQAQKYNILGLLYFLIFQLHNPNGHHGHVLQKYVLSNDFYNQNLQADYFL